MSVVITADFKLAISSWPLSNNYIFSRIYIPKKIQFIELKDKKLLQKWIVSTKVERNTSE